MVTTVDLGNVKGDKGDKGDAGVSFTIGTVTTGAPGTEAAVTNTGTTSDPIINFIIPKGETGPQGLKGDKGDTGPQGEKGDKGDTGAIVATSGMFGFYIENDNLMLSYSGSTAPDLIIDKNGNLIYTY